MELTSPPQENVNVSVPSGPYLPYAPTRSGLSTDSATPVAPVTFHEMITGTAGARCGADPDACRDARRRGGGGPGRAGGLHRLAADECGQRGGTKSDDQKAR